MKSVTLGPLALCACLSLAKTAAADPEAAPVDAPSSAESAKHQIDRTWLYLDDARVAAPMTVVGMSNASYTNAGSSPTRIDSPYPSVYRSFASNTAQPGGMISAGGEVGLFPRVSVMAMGQMGFAGEGSSPNAGAIAGLRLQVLPSSWEHAHLVVSAGYLREAWQGPVYDGESGKWSPGAPNGDNGAWIQTAFSGDVHRVRMGATFHGEHVFAGGRDGLDIMVQLGASYRVVDTFRLGVEYVGQDLEETLASAAEGGARHFAGPTASVQLLQNRFTLVAGPSFGLSELSPRLLGRVALAYGF